MSEEKHIYTLKSNQIWKSVKDAIEKRFDDKVVPDDAYITTKIKYYKDEIKTHFNDFKNTY